MQNDTSEQLPPPRAQQPHGAPDDVGRLGEVVVVEVRIDRAGLERLARLGVEHFAVTAPPAPARAPGARRSSASTWRYCALVASRCACVPVAAMRPSSSISTTRSASAIVAGRWAMISVVRPCITSASARADLVLLRGVDRGGGVVEDQDTRVGEDRAGDRQPLALATRQREAVLAEQRVVAVGQLADEVVGAGESRRVHDPLVVDVAFTAAAPRTRGSPRRCR